MSHILVRNKNTQYFRQNESTNKDTAKEKLIFALMHTKFILLNTIITLLFLITFAGQAQVSHGGKPLPYTILKSTTSNFFQEMPSFDIDAEMKADSLDQDFLRGSFRFAYKFITDYTPSNSGYIFYMPDGTKVWRLGIRSAKAYSLNILFTEYELPEGAQLFLYTPDQSQILGSFNHLNNSELGILPVSPIHSEELIIEYQEPPTVTFSGKLKVGEVNHGYRDLRSSEPGNNSASYYCMPSPICMQDTTKQYDEITRSVVLLIINGTTLCSGALINNTQNDGRPYLLTASHCLNNQFKITNPDYVQIAGTIVCFFNYESPFCSTTLRGTEEMSVASTIYRAVNEKTDLALLELIEIPPIYYRPYYAGWNISENTLPPYTNIHHPGGSVKRINLCSKEIKLISYVSDYNFNPESHWKVEEWAVGCTAGGSSGSPLFDSNNQIIGALTGGQSTCSSPKNDLFYALHKSWTSGDADSTNLKPWLDPKGDQLSCNGFDPYESNKARILSNITNPESRELYEATYLPAPDSGQQFGVNSLQTPEYAESFTTLGDATLFGAYFITPEIKNNTQLNVEINVYQGDLNNSPSSILYTTSFTPTYTNNNSDNNFQETAKNLSRAQESFIKFDEPVSISGNFFIGYKITASEKDSFTVYNLPNNSTTSNSTWINYQNKWIENTAHPNNPFKTALFISPVIQYNDPAVKISDIHTQNLKVITDRTNRRITVNLPAEALFLKYELISIDGRIVQNGYLSNEQNVFTVRQPGIFILRLYQHEQEFISKIVL